MLLRHRRSQVGGGAWPQSAQRDHQHDVRGLGRGRGEDNRTDDGSAPLRSTTNKMLVSIVRDRQGTNVMQICALARMEG
jgi:hypothetical protein